MPDKLFGAPMPPREAERLVRGRGRFVDDVDMPGALAAAFVRSQYGHAVINAIDAGAARALPGVVAVYTFRDLEPHLLDARIPGEMPGANFHLQVAPRVLADDEVVYVGEPIAVVIAVDRGVAEDGAGLVEVDYELLPAVADCRAAVSDGAVSVHRGLPHNRVVDFEFDYGNVASAFADAPHTFRESFWIRRGGAHSIEGRGVVARHDRAQDELTVWSSTQRPHALKQVLCELTGRPEERVRVVTPDVGGAFGPKLVTYPEEVVVALAAVLAGRPVKWIEDRYEHFVASTQEHDQYWDVAIAVERDGRIRGIRGALLHDQGAYTARGVNVPYAAGLTLPLPYEVPAYHLDVHVVLTNRVPVTPIRGAGQPQGTFVMERLLDRVARRLGLDRAEIRRRNLVAAERMPCRKPLKLRGGTPVILDSGDYPGNQALALEQADWAGFPVRQAQARAQGRWLGIGLANYVEGTGRGPYESVTVRVNRAGTYEVHSGATAMGQGTATMLTQIVADELNCGAAQITLSLGDTATSATGFGGFNSRLTVIAGASAKAAARALRERIVRIASSVLEAAQEDLILEGGTVAVRGVKSPRMELGTLARLAAGRPGYALPVPELGPGLSASAAVNIDDMAFSCGSAVAEVEIDPDSGNATVSRFVLVHDCGRMVNPALVEGQLVGAIAHGISATLYERMNYDDNAQPLTTTLADYLMVSAAEVPAIEIHHRESPSPLNELGVKGVGESGIIPTSAVIASAIEDALAPLGVEVTQVPLTPVVLSELLESAGTHGEARHDRLHWRADVRRVGAR